MTRAPRGPRLMAAGAASIAALFAIYASIASDPGAIVPGALGALVRLSYAFYAVLAASLGAVAAGLYWLHRDMLDAGHGLLATIAYVTRARRARAVFAATLVSYGVFFSLTSGTLVYQPEVFFSYHYGAEIPSAQIVPCCDLPGYSPKILVYVTEHVGLQVIPVNLVLQIAVSYLVALNMSIAVTAASLPRAGRGAPGVGAITGLFIACPTCVGSAASLFVGAAGGIALGAALAHVQTALIAVSLPVLAATPFLLARRLRGAFACDTP